MRQIRVSSTLTIYHDGQFWVGMFERVENGTISACRIVFGAEPSNEEIGLLVCDGWNSLHFTEPIGADEVPSPAKNPKRRQREASRELGKRGPSTKAQQALSEEREAMVLRRKSELHDNIEAEKQRRFDLQKEKRKQKHRGR